jgi:hypothetical protein
MTTAATALADKLLSEGERVLAYFGSLPADVWAKPIYSEGPGWKVRDTFEHLIISEETLQLLYESILREGRGVQEGFNTNQFNAEHTGDLLSMSLDDLASRYSVIRRRTADFTRALSDEQLTIRARHPGLGDSTLEEMIKLIYIHHSMHMRDVKRSIS